MSVRWCSQCNGIVSLLFIIIDGGPDPPDNVTAIHPYFVSWAGKVVHSQSATAVYAVGATDRYLFLPALSLLGARKSSIKKQEESIWWMK